MARYRVRGQLFVEFTCNCPDCEEIHDKEMSSVDIVVAAPNVEEAEETALILSFNEADEDRLSGWEIIDYSIHLLKTKEVEKS